MATTSKPGAKKWSQHVTDTSDALDLKDGVFKQADPKKIAKSLKTSAEHSDRRKSDPYRAAMSMLTFYINRAGHTLEAHQRKHLEDAKDELRALFDRPQRATASRTTRSSGAAKKAAPRKTAAKRAERPSS